MTYDNWKATNPADAEYHEPRLRLVTCPECGGFGGMTEYTPWPRKVDGEERNCPVCDGGGTIVEEEESDHDRT